MLPKTFSVRAGFAALALTLGLGLAAPAQAQHGQDPRPAVQTTNPSGQNPTQSVREEDLLRQLQGGSHMGGRVSIPDYKASVLQQPQGRDYREFRETYLPWIGGLAVLGMIGALAVFFFTRGRIALEHSEQSGEKILRFNAFERFTHWLTALTFIALAISGLNYIFGKRLLLPIIGPEAFAAWSQYAKFAHNYLSWPFMAGLLVMILIWIRDNIPDRTDMTWLKEGGGLMSGRAVPARRFNAGQKMIYWSVALGGLALAASGLIMLFPFSALDINGMQLAQYVHATVGVLLIAIMIAHIYIGSLGMEGAYDAMGSGEVDLDWARHHHSLWVEEQRAKTASGPQLGGSRPQPAE